MDDVIAKSLAKSALTVEETAVLLAADQPELVEGIFEAARELKRAVYGNRIVLFAPLYVGNDCVNDCRYCGFRRSNRGAVRRTLDDAELRRQVEALENVGHKRLILVFGEHPRYDAEFIARCVRTVYATRAGHGEIRRVNINAAPLDHEGYRDRQGRPASARTRFSRRPITTRRTPACIRPARARATTCGGWTA